jgi:hypothetical protein
VAAVSEANKTCAVLRDLVRPALRTVIPTKANGTSRMSGNENRPERSGVTLAPPFGNVFARYKKESSQFNGHARQTKGGLCRNSVKQHDSRYRNDPSAQHKKEAREFQSATVNAKIA